MEADSCYRRSCVPAGTQHRHMCVTHREIEKKNHKKGWNIKDGRDKWASKTEFGRVL